MSQQRAIRTLYKLLLKHVSQLKREGFEVVDMRMPMDKEVWSKFGGWGFPKWVEPTPLYRRETLRTMLPWLAKDTSLTGSFTIDSIMSLIRNQFRNPAADGKSALEHSITALRTLSDQAHLARCSSTHETHGVEIEVTSAFVEVKNDWEDDWDDDDEISDDLVKAAFTYRVRVTNNGPETVKLLGRHWVIRDAEGSVITEVPRHSPGVVGHTPILKPHTCFTYYSGIDDIYASKRDKRIEVGSLEGSFQMAVLGGRNVPVKEFDAKISRLPFVMG